LAGKPRNTHKCSLINLSLLFCENYSNKQVLWGGTAAILAFLKKFDELRLLFLGASVTAVVSAFITFMSIINFNLISINLNQLAGIFRSLLLASIFSLIERSVKFFEDKSEKEM